MNDFFSADALRSVYPDEKAKVITSIAMFYELENAHKFVGDIKASLHERGIWILELSYLPLMLKMNSFDTLCHEHLEYYSLAPMERFFAEHDLEVVDVTLNDINGGSFRIAVGHKAKVAPSAEARARANPAHPGVRARPRHRRALRRLPQEHREDSQGPARLSRTWKPSASPFSPRAERRRRRLPCT